MGKTMKELGIKINTSKEYADLAVKANAENKVIFQYKNGNYDFIDQPTYNTCIFDGEKWVENADKKSSYLQSIYNNNKDIIKSLIDEASDKISILQDAIDLDMAENGDEDKLIAWRKYRVDLSRVDTNVEEMELPEKPE